MPVSDLNRKRCDTFVFFSNSNGQLKQSYQSSQNSDKIFNFEQKSSDIVIKSFNIVSDHHICRPGRKGLSNTRAQTGD
jgi:hypothetical protein